MHAVRACVPPPIHTPLPARTRSLQAQPSYTHAHSLHARMVGGGAGGCLCGWWCWFVPHSPWQCRYTTSIRVTVSLSSFFITPRCDTQEEKSEGRPESVYHQHHHRWRWWWWSGSFICGEVRGFYDIRWLFKESSSINASLLLNVLTVIGNTPVPLSRWHFRKNQHVSTFLRGV
jgi:hypothetical protein